MVGDTSDSCEGDQVIEKKADRWAKALWLRTEKEKSGDSSPYFCLTDWAPGV